MLAAMKRHGRIATELPHGLVRCPGCAKGHLAGGPDPHAAVRCDGCAATYPVDGGILHLLPEPRARSLAQLTMELHPIVRVYESRLWRRNPALRLLLGLSYEQEREHVLRIAGLTGRESVLDLACGTGLYSRELARRVPSGVVVGLDRSLPMLGEATRRASHEGLANLIWIHGDAAHLPLESARFDLVICCGALHLFTDVAGVLKEIARVLKPSGRLVVAAFQRPEGLVAELTVGLRRRLVGLHAFTRAELESSLTGAGFGWIECPHRRGGWLVMSGVKTGAGARTES